MKSNLPVYLKFYLNNWVKISLVYFPPLTSDPRELLENMVPDTKNVVWKHVTEGWSCFFASRFLVSSFGYKPPYEDLSYDKKYETNPKTYKLFEKIFKPGFVYYFMIENHEFLVIYNRNKTLYYVDYYNETDRKDFFRIEKLDPTHFSNYIQSYYKGDIQSYYKFNKFVSIPDQDDQTVVYQIYKYPIKRIPTIQDLKRTLIKNVKENPVEDDVKYLEFRQKILRELLRK